MNSLNRDTIKLKEEHQFSPDILNKDNQTGLCVCGLPQDNPLHGYSLNRDRETSIEINTSGFPDEAVLIVSQGEKSEYVKAKVRYAKLPFWKWVLGFFKLRFNRYYRTKIVDTKPL